MIEVDQRKNTFFPHLHKGHTKSLRNIISKCPVGIKRYPKFCRMVQT